MKKSLIFILFLAHASIAAVRYPILLVHGLSSDMGTWGARRLGNGVIEVGQSCNTQMDNRRVSTTICSCPEGYEQVNPPNVSRNKPSEVAPACRKYSGLGDLVESYSPGSAADILAKRFGVSTAPNDINSNGLYFYNSKYFNNVLAPFADLGITCDNGVCGQTKQLRDRIREVLDDHYGSLIWPNNPDAKVIIVAHSQGGIISRNLFKEYSSNLLGEPINHIEKIITIGTPHLGSPWAMDLPDVAPISWLKPSLLAAKEKVAWMSYVPIFGSLSGIGSINRTLDHFLTGAKQLDKTRPFLTNLNASSFPTNGYSGKKIPLTTLFATAPGLANDFEGLLEHTAQRLRNDAWDSQPQIVKDSHKNQGNWTMCYNVMCPVKVPLPIKITAEVVKSDQFNLYYGWFKPAIYQFRNNWEAKSDFLVDVSSQTLEGKYIGAPIRRIQLKPGKTVPHMTISGYYQEYAGETTMGNEIFSAIMYNPGLIPATLLLML